MQHATSFGRREGTSARDVQELLDVTRWVREAVSRSVVLGTLGVGGDHMPTWLLVLLIVLLVLALFGGFGYSRR